VQFGDAVGAGHLVQAVDVLGDDAEQLVLALQPGEGEVGGVGPRVGVDELLSVEVEERGRVALHEAVGDDLLGAQRAPVGLRVDAVGAAEVGDAGFGGHPGTAEERDATAGGDEAGEFCDGIRAGSHAPRLGSTPAARHPLRSTGRQLDPVCSRPPFILRR
jgi:hypothetical protein